MDLQLIPWTLAVQYEMNGRVADSMLVNTALMLIYITKFFWWESGYWCTMDIAHDRGITALLQYYGIQMIIFSTSFAFYVMFNLFHFEKFWFFKIE